MDRNEREDYTDKRYIDIEPFFIIETLTEHDNTKFRQVYSDW